ncbi:hypothetical protein Tco_0829473 [Tanacetum coccineum]
MPPRRFKKKSVKRLVEKRVAKAIEEYEKTRADSNNAGGSGSANTGGTVAPEVQGCSYKTFMNGKPHSFNGTEGVVGLKRWFEKIEQVFEICKCAKDDKNLTLKGYDIEAYNNHFHKLVLICPELLSTEKKNIEKYIGGFPKGVKGNVSSSKLATFHDAINMARELIEEECNRCKAHHQLGPCPPRCSNYHKLGNEEEDCRTRIPVAGGSSLQNVTCFGFREKRHYMSHCPELKNLNHGNQVGGTEARGMVHALVGGETNQNLNNMEDDINA